jgi:putative NIF3 family GTP cyclohydrolase 1 type 2
MPALHEIVDLVHGWYPPATADSWDAVGLVYGDPSAAVGKVLFAVDPAPEVAEEAMDWGADLLVVHHPLFLKPVHGFAATTPKGRTISTLAGAGCGLLTAHTNADRAVDGVSEAMGHALGLTDLAPLTDASGPPMDKLVVFVPAEKADHVRDAVTAAGAGVHGDNDHCTFSTTGEGRFRPLEGANPTIGSVGQVEVVDEVRVESVLPRSRRTAVVTAMLAAHPYEEPATTSSSWPTRVSPRPVWAGSGRYTGRRCSTSPRRWPGSSPRRPAGCA